MLSQLTTSLSRRFTARLSGRLSNLPEICWVPSGELSWVQCREIRVTLRVTAKTCAALVWDDFDLLFSKEAQVHRQDPPPSLPTAGRGACPWHGHTRLTPAHLSSCLVFHHSAQGSLNSNLGFFLLSARRLPTNKHSVWCHWASCAEKSLFRSQTQLFTSRSFSA